MANRSLHIIVLLSKPCYHGNRYTHSTGNSFCLSVGLFSINNHFSKRFWLINGKILADENLLFLVFRDFIHDSRMFEDGSFAYHQKNIFPEKNYLGNQLSKKSHFIRV